MALLSRSLSNWPLHLLLITFFEVGRRRLSQVDFSLTCCSLRDSESSAFSFWVRKCAHNNKWLLIGSLRANKRDRIWPTLVGQLTASDPSLCFTHPLAQPV